MTRWVERHDTSLYFENKLMDIIDVLDNIRTWQDPVSSPKANMLINSMLTAPFLIALKCINYISSLTQTLSNLFKKIS